MKRKMKILVWTCLGILILYNCFCMHLDGKDGGTITYSYGGIEFTESLTDEEARTVTRILNGKIPFADNPSCGYTEKISICIDGWTFALACDSCADVRICETGKYIGFSDEERDTLEEMFTSCGGVFPCV